jgi:hypothetical protein
MQNSFLIMCLGKAPQAEQDKIEDAIMAAIKSAT